MRTLSFQRVLGSGAFGSVYLAELAGGSGFRRACAVKVLHSEHAGGAAFLSRVRDEARLLGLLQDDHILEVMELARVDGRDAVLMEYVEGADLDAIVALGLRPPPRALAELGAVTASALHRAHRARHPGTNEPLNVVHRDVKPANLMVTERGGVKLLDFGVARARFEMRESRTGQFVLGTLNYMAPEYITTGDVSPAADVYALGLTLWEAAVGEVFGQPRLRADLHRARLEERLAVVPTMYAALLPHLRDMLAWEPHARPDAGDVERRLFAAADALQGTGLRAWAAQAVPQALARTRTGAQDTCGLLGRTVPIEPPDASPAPGDPDDTAASDMLRAVHSAPIPMTTPLRADDPAPQAPQPGVATTPAPTREIELPPVVATPAKGWPAAWAPVAFALITGVALAVMVAAAAALFLVYRSSR